MKPIVGGLLIMSVLFSHARLEKTQIPEFPHFQDLILLPDQEGLQDLALIVSGFRSVAADLAWIQLLQYAGGVSVFDKTGEAAAMPHLKNFTLRVMRIDPHFVQAVVFGSGLLAWLRTINRPEEAVEILSEGIKYNPTYWPFHSYLVSLAYRKSDQVEKMLSALGDTLSHPDCPPLVKAILANTFKLNKRYKEAIAIWVSVYETTSDNAFKERALREIAEIKGL